MLDNLLRLPSMNNILKLLNFSLINNEEIDFDFLKLELVNKESNNNFTPISFYYEPYFNRSSTDLKSICDITHKPLSEASTQLNDIDDLNEKKKDYIEGSSIFIENEFFLEKKFEMTDNKFEYNDITNDIYRFYSFELPVVDTTFRFELPDRENISKNSIRPFRTHGH